MTATRIASPLPLRADGQGAGDIRTEREAAVRLALRMQLLRAIRVISLLGVDVAALTAVWVAWRMLGIGAAPAEAGLLFVWSGVLGLAALGTYAVGDPRRDPRRLARGLVLGIGGLWLMGTQLGLMDPAPGPVLALAAASLTLVIPARWLLDRLARRINLRGFMRRRVLIVGDRGSAEAVLEHFQDATASKLEVVGRLATGPGDPEADGGIMDLPDLLGRHPADVVLLTQSVSGGQLDTIARASFRRGVRVELVPAVVRDLEFNVTPQLLFGCPVMEIRPDRLGVPQMAVKRVADILLAGTALVVLAPVIALIAVAIRLESPGPVLFRQVRAGLGGRTFPMWKFRTMRADAAERRHDLHELNPSGDPRLFKIPDDPRITPVGRFLRRWSLDEIPQLFNIFRGDMSFVGPRPFFPEDLPLYEPHHLERLSVMPGLTGLWQVSGRSEITAFDDVVELDRRYIRDWSLSLDLEILLRTVPAVFRRKGAY